MSLSLLSKIIAKIAHCGFRTIEISHSTYRYMMIKGDFMPTHTTCPRCQTLPAISSSAGDVLISCEVTELTRKFIAYLKTKTMNFREEDEYTLWISVSSFESFLDALLQSNFFDATQAKAITLLFLANGVSFTPGKIREAKSIQKYQELLGSMELSTLIQKGALTTHFQPIITLSTNKIYGYESLARGVEDDGALIYPDKLFKWAREGDMIFYLDRACREMSLKTAAVKNITSKVFINFIPTAIYDPAFCLASTVKWAKQLDFDPKNIIFEVVESDHVTDVEHLTKILEYYKSQGFKVALDDVGSGYSSLNLLAKLKPDIVKIDREIMDRIDTNPINQSIFKAIVSIAKENDILVLAEGVERAEEVAFAAANGADLAQGYYFGKPSIEPIRKI